MYKKEITFGKYKGVQRLKQQFQEDLVRARGIVTEYLQPRDIRKTNTVYALDLPRALDDLCLQGHNYITMVYAVASYLNGRIQDERDKPEDIPYPTLDKRLTHLIDMKDKLGRKDAKKKRRPQ
jgi:hypothetical protein